HAWGMYLCDRGLPDKLEIKGKQGAAKCTRLALRSKASRIGSISGEWKAWETFNSRVWMPSDSKVFSMACTACRSPDITVFSGPLTPAIEICSRKGARNLLTLASSANT